MPMTPTEVTTAKTICEPCPARTECLLWALLEGEGWGVWGGLTKPERVKAMEAYDGDAYAVVTAHSTGELEQVLRPLAVVSA